MKSKKKKERLDNILAERGFFETKSQAQAAILAGLVRIDGQIISKAGTQISIDTSQEIQVESLPYVSRGGFKLEKALKEFDVRVKDKICLDTGASTGGFVDCLLQNGAQKIYAVDVGYGQLAWKLRTDPRVVVVERTNIRNSLPKDIYKDIDYQNNSLIINNLLFAELVTLDLSFISITKVLKNIKSLMNPDKQEIIALIKPQFEAGKDQVPKSGVIRDKNIHVNIIKNIIEYACTIDIYPVNLTYSPIKGPAGNIEYLMYMTNEKNYIINEDRVKKVVDEAHECLISN